MMFSDELWPRIGEPGRLLPIQFAAPEKLEQEDRYSSVTTLTGARRAQVRPRQPRSWSVDVPYGRGVDTAHIDAFASGAWGNGPWTFVSVAAQQGNLLTPRESVLLDRAGISAASIQDAGPVRDSTGAWSPRSVTVSIPSGWGALARGIPVIGGSPFTFSLDVQGGTSAPGIHVAFYDAAGNPLSGGGGATSGSGTGMQRVSASYTVPLGAVEAQAGVRDTTIRATRPQATWTSSPVDWEIGHGCSSAIVLKGDSTLRMLEGGVTPLYNSAYTIMEVS